MCLGVYICADTYVCVHVDTFKDVCVYVNTFASVCADEDVVMCPSVCTHASVSVCSNVYTSVGVYFKC